MGFDSLGFCGLGFYGLGFDGLGFYGLGFAVCVLTDARKFTQSVQRLRLRLAQATVSLSDIDSLTDIKSY